MQDNTKQQNQKDNQQTSQRDFYIQSLLKQNVIADISNDISINETLDTNLEKVYFI
jgi:hypothetical protein